MVLPDPQDGAGVRPIEVALPAGYALRVFRAGDEEGYIRVMRLAGFVDWDHDSIASLRQTVLPDGIFFAVHEASDLIVTTACANYKSTPLHPDGAEIGWVAGDPDHRGRGLGFAACAAAIRRFRQAGKAGIYLSTDDWRLPAIKVYLKLGLVPFLYAPDMPDRWRAVYGQLGLAFDPATACAPDGIDFLDQGGQHGHDPTRPGQPGIDPP